MKIIRRKKIVHGRRRIVREVAPEPEVITPVEPKPKRPSVRKLRVLAREYSLLPGGLSGHIPLDCQMTTVLVLAIPVVLALLLRGAPTFAGIMIILSAVWAALMFREDMASSRPGLSVLRGVREVSSWERK